MVVSPQCAQGKIADGTVPSQHQDQAGVNWLPVCYLSGMPTDKPLAEAIRRAGGVRALARAVGVAHTVVLRWKKVPAVRVLAIERLTCVSRYKLRPDVYGPAPQEDKRG